MKGPLQVLQNSDLRH